MTPFRRLLIYICLASALIVLYYTTRTHLLGIPRQALSWQHPSSLGLTNYTFAPKRPARSAKKFTEKTNMSQDQIQTFDGWPVFSRNYFPGPIPRSPFQPDFRIEWDFDTTELLERQDVQAQPAKILTWMFPTRYMPDLPEPVRLRFCPEMPCRMTTNQTYRDQSAALLWFIQTMPRVAPPPRAHPDQVFVFHNNEPQSNDWNMGAAFRKPEWRSVFNWTINYRSDSDIITRYGLVVKRSQPLAKNYTAIVANKTKLAVWMSSHCDTYGKREQYVKLMQKYVSVDVYGGCSSPALNCPRSQDDECIQTLGRTYKFFLAFENNLCRDYVTEKFFRYLNGDMIVVARASNDYHRYAPPGIFINTNDFPTVKKLTDHLLYLDQHPQEYIKLLQAKDQYQALYEDWPIRDSHGNVLFMHYHYEAVAYCELCRRLWDLNRYRQVIPDIVPWFDKANCYPPKDLV